MEEFIFFSLWTALYCLLLSFYNILNIHESISYKIFKSSQHLIYILIILIWDQVLLIRSRWTQTHYIVQSLINITILLPHLLYLPLIFFNDGTYKHLLNCEHLFLCSAIYDKIPIYFFQNNHSISLEKFFWV